MSDGDTFGPFSIHYEAPFSVYRVMHTPTGYAVGDFVTMPAAETWARKQAGCDWWHTSDGSRIRASARCRQAMDEIRS